MSRLKKLETLDLSLNIQLSNAIIRQLSALKSLKNLILRDCTYEHFPAQGTYHIFQASTKNKTYNQFLFLECEVFLRELLIKYFSKSITSNFSIFKKCFLNFVEHLIFNLEVPFKNIVKQALNLIQ